MAVSRGERNKGYTVMSNYHLRNRALSLRHGAVFTNDVLARGLGLYPFVKVREPS